MLIMVRHGLCGPSTSQLWQNVQIPNILQQELQMVNLCSIGDGFSCRGMRQDFRWDDISQIWTDRAAGAAPYRSIGRIRHPSWWQADGNVAVTDSETLMRMLKSTQEACNEFQVAQESLMQAECSLFSIR